MTTGVGDITIRFICMLLQACPDASGVIHGSAKTLPYKNKVDIDRYISFFIFRFSVFMIF